MPDASDQFLGRSVVNTWPPLRKPGTDTPDDDFDSTTLNPKWTVVAGASGTANPVNTSNAAVYDLASRPSWLLMEVGNGGTQDVKLRQDYTVPDGQSIVAAFAPGSVIKGEPGTGNQDLQGGIAVNTDDSDEQAGTYLQVQIQTQAAGGLRITAGNGTTNYSSGTFGSLGYYFDRLFLRIIRSGTTYFPLFSTSGVTWIALGSGFALASTMSNVWVFAENENNFTGVNGVLGVDWVRQGGNLYAPW